MEEAFVAIKEEGRLSTKVLSLLEADFKADYWFFSVCLFMFFLDLYDRGVYNSVPLPLEYSGPVRKLQHNDWNW